MARSSRRPAARPAVRRRWWIAAAGVAGTAVLTAVIGYVVPKVLDRATADDPPPVSVSLQSDPSRVSAFDSVERAVAVPGQDVPAPDPGAGCQDLYTWARSRGGADSGASRLHLLVRGVDEGQVVISEIRAVVDERLPDTPRQHLACRPEGELENRVLSITLDEPRPVARYESPDGRPFGFTVAKGEVEAFLITASSTTASLRWHLEVDVVAGDERSTVRIDDGGRPLSTAARSEDGHWLWDAGAWIPKGPAAGAREPGRVPPGRTLPALAAK